MLCHTQGVSFYTDKQHNRVGMLTTNAIKHAMCQLTVLMLEEHRIHVHKPLVSRDPKGMLLRLREQMEIYSYQFKMAATTFQKDVVAISGKVGGMKDDICICLQLACYFTQVSSLSCLYTRVHSQLTCLILLSVRADGAAAKLEAQCASVNMKHRETLWTFMYHDNIEHQKTYAYTVVFKLV